MLLQYNSGPLAAARVQGQGYNAPGGTFGEGLFSELTPNYYTLAKSGRIFSLSGAALTPTIFAGGAAGTPLLGLYNPAGSGFDLAVILTSLGIRTTGTAAVNWDASYWGVNQGGVAVTGTQTQCRNAYSMAQTGSVTYGMVNTANTAALASSLLRSHTSGGLTAATAVTNVSVLNDEVKGALIIAPGCYLAYGMFSSGTLTASSFDASIIWAEIPA